MSRGPGSRRAAIKRRIQRDRARRAIESRIAEGLEAAGREVNPVILRNLAKRELWLARKQETRQ